MAVVSQEGWVPNEPVLRKKLNSYVSLESHQSVHDISSKIQSIWHGCTQDTE